MPRRFRFLVVVFAAAAPVGAATGGRFHVVDQFVQHGAQRLRQNRGRLCRRRLVQLLLRAAQKVFDDALVQRQMLLGGVGAKPPQDLNGLVEAVAVFHQLRGVNGRVPENQSINQSINQSNRKKKRQIIDS